MLERTHSILIKVVKAEVQLETENMFHQVHGIFLRIKGSLVRVQFTFGCSKSMTSYEAYGVVQLGTGFRRHRGIYLDAEDSADASVDAVLYLLSVLLIEAVEEVWSPSVSAARD